MRSRRARATTYAATVFVMVPDCARRPDERSSTVRRRLLLGAAAVPAWHDSSSASAAVSLGYTERLRLGLGSPYRLIDYAQNDARLDEAARERLGWALLAGIGAGEAYEVD